MNGFEWNKIFGALLLAALIAALAGFVSGQVMYGEHEAGKEAKKGYIVANVEAAEAGAAPVAAAPATAEPIDGLLDKADVAAGQKLSRACVACHSFDKDGPNKVGPHLYEVVGRMAGTASGFNYSDALKGLGKTWTTEELNHWLFNPKAHAPGNKMAYAGMKNTQDRANLIAWLKTLK